jgi:uncharacterized lipoprotein YmbA
LLLLGACGTSPPSAYYTLDEAKFDYSPDAAAATILGIGPIRVPEYLERPQMVTRGDKSELLIDDFNRWAEPIVDAQHRIIASNVDALLEDVIVVGYPYSSVADYDAKMVGRIDRFDMDATGTTRLDVFWTVASADSELLVQPRRSVYTVSGGKPGNPNSVAEAMSDCLTQFSRDIADAFEAARTASPQ